jgi:hypothetical protein
VTDIDIIRAMLTRAGLKTEEGAMKSPRRRGPMTAVVSRLSTRDEAESEGGAVFMFNAEGALVSVDG